MVYEVEAIFSQSAGLEPRKTLNWGSLFCAVPSTLSNIQEWVHPVEDVPFIVLHILAALSNAFFFLESYMKVLNKGIIFTYQLSLKGDLSRVMHISLNQRICLSCIYQLPFQRRFI